MQISDIFGFIQDGQRLFHETIVNDLQQIKATGSFLTSLGLICVGFLYGALHAVGPGHGKVIVSSYMLANENSLKRGLIIVVFSALLQACIAVILVISFFYIFNLARSEAEHATAMLEMASYLLVGMIGVGLIVRGMKEFWSLKKSKTHQEQAHHECCHHSHIPDSKKIEMKQGAGAFVIMVLSIGLRPCTGAILLLFFSCIVGAVWSGIIATFAMSIGTALTTGLLAVLTVKSRDVALHFLKTSEKGMVLAQASLSLLGGLIVVLMSSAFLLSTPLVGNNNGVKDNSAKLPLMHLPNSMR
jgi:nickel/cobalt transporter (NicO) family protein